MEAITPDVHGRSEARGAREVLVQALRRALGTASAGTAPRLRDGTHEELLVQAVMRHRVAAFLHPALEQGFLGTALPIDFVGLCRQAYFTTLRRNLVTLEVGEALLGLAAERGLATAPRGPWSLLRGSAPVHPDPGERPVDRLELSFPAEAEVELRDVARGLGFGLRQESRVLWRPIGRWDLALQLHPGRPAADATDHLLDAAAGLGRDRFGRWVGLLDIHRLIVRNDVEPSELARRARLAGRGRALDSSLRLARSVLATPVPAAWRAGGRRVLGEGRAIPPGRPAPASPS